MVKRIFATILVAVGLGFGMSGTAYASPQAAASGGFSTSNLWYVYGTYVPYEACFHVGEDLKNRGEIIAYYCEPRGGPYPFWILHVYVT